MNRLHGLVLICASIAALSGCLSVPPEQDAALHVEQEPYPDPILSGKPETETPDPLLPKPPLAPDPPEKNDLETAAGQPVSEAEPDATGSEDPNGVEGEESLQDQASLPPPDVVEPLDPKSLVGADREAIRTRFGEPDREEERTPGFVWHYRKSECALSLFFYLDVKSNTYRTLTYELLAQDPKEGWVSQGGTDDADRNEHCYRRFGNARG